MIITTLVKPISCKKLKNLQVTDYILVYFDKDKKLKRAIPDFDERFFDYNDSLILDAIEAEKIAPFMFVRNAEEGTAPIFDIQINDSGEVIGYGSRNGDNLQLGKFLLDSKQRRNTSKLLKKRK